MTNQACLCGWCDAGKDLAGDRKRLEYPLYPRQAREGTAGPTYVSDETS